MAASRDGASAKIFIEVQSATPYQHCEIKSPDTYVVVRVGSSVVHTTKRINNSRAPVWKDGDDRKFSATVSQDSILYFQLVDHNTIRKDVVLGDGLLRVADLSAMKVGATNVRVPIQLHSESAIADPTQHLPLMTKLLLHIDISQLIACGVIVPAVTQTGAKPEAAEPAGMADAAVAALRKANKEMETHLVSGAITQLAALYDPDALLAPPPHDPNLPLSTIVGRDQIRAFWTGVADSDVSDVAFGSDEQNSFAHADSDAIVTQTGPYSTSAISGSRIVEWSIDDDGHWHIIRESFDGPLPTPSPANE